MKEEITHFVKTCIKYQLNRASYQKQAGLLQPLPILLNPWNDISMDFMTSLLEVQGFEIVLVIEDCFNKFTNMVPNRRIISFYKITKLFLDTL